jgi:hypothetical protein
MDNGNKEEAKQLTVDQVVITRDRTTGAVSFACTTPDIDLALDMLGRATRHLDVQFRVNAGIAAQQKLKDAQAEYDLTQRLMRK